MEFILAITTGILFAAGFYLMLRRSLVKLMLGILFLSHAANLLIFCSAGIEYGKPPIIAEGLSKLMGAHADPLPQALILTAIVIGFGVQAFFLVLMRKVYELIQNDDLDEMRGEEE